MDNHAREIMLITGGVISTLCSGSVVLTGFLFSKTMLSRTHPFSNMIFFISLCDMLGSIGIAMGYPGNGSIHCQAQAFLILFFFPASWLWTTALVYQLRSMMFYKRLHISMFLLHCICWCIALLVALLPLSQNEYGEDDDLEGRSVCNLTSSHRHRKFQWLIGLYYGVLIACMLLMVGLMVNSYRQIQAMRTTTFTDYKERAIFKATRWYPLGMLLTWSLSIAVTIMLAILSDVRVDYIQAGQIAQSQYGTLLAVIFFSNSKIVRHRWRELYRTVFSRILPPSGSSAETQQVRVSEESLDPEGEKFAGHESMTEGPRLSEIIQSLGRFAQSSTSSKGVSGLGMPRQGSSDSSSETGSDTGEAGVGGGMRVSAYVRDWLVTKTRHTDVEMSSTSGTPRKGSRERSANNSNSGALASLFSFRRNSSSTTDLAGRTASPSPHGADTAAAAAAVDGTAGQQVTSPLAEALVRAKEERAAARSGNSSPKSSNQASSSRGGIGPGEGAEV